MKWVAWSNSRHILIDGAGVYVAYVEIGSGYPLYIWDRMVCKRIGGEFSTLEEAKAVAVARVLLNL